MEHKRPNERRLQKMSEMGEHLEELRASMRECKTERLQLRVTSTEKEEVDRITSMLGVSAADYLMYLHEKAMKDFERKLDFDARRRGNDGGSSKKVSRSRRSDDDEPTTRGPRRRGGRGGRGGSAAQLV